MWCREDGLPLELFMQLTMSSAIQREGCTVHESPQVVVFVKIGYPVLHFVRVKVRLHVSYLYIGLGQKNRLVGIHCRIVTSQLATAHGPHSLVTLLLLQNFYVCEWAARGINQETERGPHQWKAQLAAILSSTLWTYISEPVAKIQKSVKADNSCLSLPGENIVWSDTIHQLYSIPELSKNWYLIPVSRLREACGLGQGDPEINGPGAAAS